MPHRRYFRPIPDPAGGRWRLAGGWVGFSALEVLRRGAAPEVVTDAPPQIIAALTAPRPALLGLAMDAPRIMGIVNVTPDSFSDGGRWTEDGGIAHGRALIADGADILDIGGESTRPGAAEVAMEAEIARVLPAITALAGTASGTGGVEAGERRSGGIVPQGGAARDGIARNGVVADEAAEAEVAEEAAQERAAQAPPIAPRFPVSIDTRKAAVAQAAVEAGAGMVNDVSGLDFDPAMAAEVARSGAAICLMHAQGLPETMQDDPRYGDVLLDVYDALETRIARAVAAGIPRDRIVIDPGIGFGKTLAHNLAILRRISVFHALGVPVLLGASRKRFIGTLGGADAAADRDPGSLAVTLAAVGQGVQIHRVHDVRGTRQGLTLWQAITQDDEGV